MYSFSMEQIAAIAGGLSAIIGAAALVNRYIKKDWEKAIQTLKETFGQMIANLEKQTDERVKLLENKQALMQKDQEYGVKEITELKGMVKDLAMSQSREWERVSDKLDKLQEGMGKK